MESLTTLETGDGTVILRRAVAADLPDIVALLAADQLGAHREAVSPGPDALAPYRAAFDAIDADPAHLLVTGDAAGQVVATMQLTFLPGLARRGAWRAQIEAVRVHERYRRRGLGEFMLRWAIGEAARRGCSLVQLTTDKTRTDAHRFYRRLGFVDSHEGMELRLPPQ